MASPIVLKAFSPWVTNGPGFLIVCNKDSSETRFTFANGCLVVLVGIRCMGITLRTAYSVLWAAFVFRSSKRKWQLIVCKAHRQGIDGYHHLWGRCTHYIVIGKVGLGLIRSLAYIAQRSVTGSMGSSTYLMDGTLIVCNKHCLFGWQDSCGSLIVCDKHNDLGFIHDGGLSYCSW